MFPWANLDHYRTLNSYINCFKYFMLSRCFYVFLNPDWWNNVSGFLTLFCGLNLKYLAVFSI